MSKHRPTSDRLANELLGASAFFRPTSQASEEHHEGAARPTSPVRPARAPEPHPSNDVATSRRQRVTTSSPPASPAPPAFDINRATTSRDSLRLSPDETKALDSLRSSLKWDNDLTVSKNDICRVALHWLLEDAMSTGENSEVIRRLKRKLSSR